MNIRQMNYSCKFILCFLVSVFQKNEKSNQCLSFSFFTFMKIKGSDIMYHLLYYVLLVMLYILLVESQVVIS